MNGAMPMRAEMRQALQGWYNPALIDKVRFKIGDGGEFNLANNAIRLRDVAAITLLTSSFQRVGGCCLSVSLGP
jgi:hypothetical protein